MAFKSIKKTPKEQQANKTPELAAAKKAFENFFIDNNLDPTKDYSKDKKYGKEFCKLRDKLQKERDKVAAAYPDTDPKKLKRLKKQAEGIVRSEEKKAKKKEAEAKEKTPRTSKYDYPLVDGREMTSDEKKKYRMQMRKQQSGTTSKPAPKAKESKEEKTSKADKKAKKDKKKAKKHDED